MKLKLFKSKKALLFVLFLAILFIITMASFFLRLHFKKAPFDKNIGGSQIEILQNLNAREAELFFLDQSARYAIISSLIEVGNKGSADGTCGNLDGYYFWQNLIDDPTTNSRILKACYPKIEDFRKLIEENTLNNMDTYLQSDFIKNYALSKKDYELLVDSGEKLRIIGTPLKTIKIDLNNNLGYYYFRPIFDTTLDYSFSIYEELMKNIKLINTKCSSAFDLNQCVMEKIVELGVTGLRVGPCDPAEANTGASDKRIVKFCYINDEKKLPVFDGQKLESKPIEIKFAMYLQDLPPPPVENLNVFTNPLGEKSVILTWTKSAEEDVAKYIVYYSDALNPKQFEDTSMQELKTQTGTVKIAEIPAKEVYTSKIEDFSKCDLKLTTKGIACLYGNEFLEPGKLHYYESKNQFIYILQVPEDKSYNFAITAVDEGNNEIDNVKSNEKLAFGKNIVSGDSKDKLPPQLIDIKDVTIDSSNSLSLVFDGPSKNLIEFYPYKNDLQGYTLYYSQCDGIDDGTPIAEGTSIQLSPNNCGTAGSPRYLYYFALIPKDSSGNSLSIADAKRLGQKISQLDLSKNADSTFSKKVAVESSKPETAVKIDQVIYQKAIETPTDAQAANPSASVVPGYKRYTIAQIDQKIAMYAAKYGLDENLVKAVVQVESSYRQFASRCESKYNEKAEVYIANFKNDYNYDCTKDGCSQTLEDSYGKKCYKIAASYGLIQTMYPTAVSDCGLRGDPFILFDPDINLDCGVKYLAGWIAKCGSVEKGVVAYNQGSCPSKPLSEYAYAKKFNEAYSIA